MLLYNGGLISKFQSVGSYARVFIVFQMIPSDVLALDSRKEIGAHGERGKISDPRIRTPRFFQNQ